LIVEATTMRRTMRWLISCVGALALGLALAGCGDDLQATMPDFSGADLSAAVSTDFATADSGTDAGGTD
jgi:hypothetical protein